MISYKEMRGEASGKNGLVGALLLAIPMFIFLAVISNQASQVPAHLAKCDAVTVEQHRVTKFIASHWRVPKTHATEVVQVAYQAAALYDLNPVTLLAMAGRESSFQHVGNPGGGQNPMRPYGIMQVAGKWHPEKFRNGKVYRTDVPENIFIGAQIVREYLNKEKGDLRFALMRYNGTRKENDRYYQGVSLIQAQLEQAMSDRRWDA